MREMKFQNTEIGLIPEDWRIVPLGQLFDFKNGLNKGKEFFGFGTPIINFTDVFNNPQMYQSTIKGLVSVSSNDIKSCNAHKGDVFFTRTSETPEEVGMSSVLLDELDSAVFSGFVLRARPKTDLLNSEYSGLCLRSNTIRQQIIKSATYTTRALTSGAKLSDVLLPLPTLDEQRKIAKALSDIDGLIDSLTKLIDKKKNIKTGAMQELLTGKKRLAGFSEAWVEKKIEDVIIRFATGLNPRQNFVLNSGGLNYYVTIKNFRHGEVFLDDECDKIDDAALALINNRSDLRKGDLLLSSIGRVGDPCIVKSDPINWNINESVFALRPNKDIITVEFLYYIFKSDEMQRKLNDSSTGSTLTSIKMGHLKGLTINIAPTLEEQTAIATILTDMDKEIASLEAKKEKFELIKKGMMQELLTGRVRLV